MRFRVDIAILGLVVAVFAPVSVCAGQPILTPIQTFSPGESIVVRGDTALVGAWERVYEYRMEGGRWTEASRVHGPVGIGFPSGMDFDPASGSAFVGAHADPEFGRYSGSIYEYRLGNPWTFVSRIVHPDSVWGQHFGGVFRLIGDQLVVAHRGYLLVMERKDGRWVESQRLPAPRDESWGFHSDGTLAVTQARGQDEQQTAYTPRVFTRGDSLWTYANPLPALAGFESELPMDSFGSTWIIGARMYRDGYGTVYVFERAGSSLQFRGRLDAWDGDCGQPSCVFGRSVAVGERFAAVSRGWGPQTAVYIFQRVGTSWVPAAKILNPRRSESDWWEFATSMAIHDDYLTVNGWEQGNSEIHLYHLSVLLTSAEAEQNPDSYALFQNHPNPFTAKTLIEFSLPLSGHVRMIVYDVLGRQVEQLVDQSLPAGHHEIAWDARGLPSGTYLYRLTTPIGTRTGIAVLLK